MCIFSLVIPKVLTDGKIPDNARFEMETHMEYSIKKYGLRFSSLYISNQHLKRLPQLIACYFQCVLLVSACIYSGFNFTGYLLKL